MYLEQIYARCMRLMDAQEKLGTACEPQHSNAPSAKDWELCQEAVEAEAQGVGSRN
jgi:hypothetical protein